MSAAAGPPDGSLIDEVLAANRELAAGPAEPLAALPRRAIAVVTCMDARLRVPGALGLEPGDAHVLRNAGALVTDDVMRSLAISQRLLGTRAVMVVGHTDCGMARLDEDSLRAQLRAASGGEPPFSLGGFSDVEAAVGQSVLALRRSPLLPHRDEIRGFVYDVATHLLRELAVGDA